MFCNVLIFLSSKLAVNRALDASLHVEQIVYLENLRRIGDLLDSHPVRMPSGLRSERRPFTRDRVVFSFFSFPYLSLHFTASRSSKQSLKLRHKTHSLASRPNHIPSRSLPFLFLLLSLSTLSRNTFGHNAATTRRLVRSLLYIFSPSLSTYYSFTISGTSEVAFSSTRCT